MTWKTTRRNVDAFGSSNRNWDKEFESLEVLTVQEPTGKHASSENFHTNLVNFGEYFKKNRGTLNKVILGCIYLHNYSLYLISYC